MIERHLHRALEERLGKNPAVALIGPRQVGKTTLALKIADTRPSIYLDLENPGDLAKVQDIELFYAENQDKLLILDEVQRLPELFAPVRGIIDEQRRRGKKSGQFLFLGSASIDLLQQSSETLAGRISYLELNPIDALEIQQDQEGKQSQNILNQLWLRGGFPESYLAEDDLQSMDWRSDFISTYLERDIPQLGPRVPTETLRRFWTMLAHYQSATLNAANLAKGLGISGQSVVRYLDLLVDLLLVRRLQPWMSNTGKRMVKSPKVFIRDSGITHALLGIERRNDLLGHPGVGGSWEGFVIENLLAVAPSRTQSYFYRSIGGAEIDLILQLKPGKFWAVEIKHSLAPKLSRGFHIACDELDIEQSFIVYPGSESYPVADNITAIPLPELMKQLTLARRSG